MTKLIYSVISSLDGYFEDEEGSFDWAAPDDEVHAFVNDLERPIGTHLYGRRMYETMVFWETAPAQPDQPPVGLDYANLWRAADKIVYSTTLQAASSARTRIESTFDPNAVRAIKDAADRDLSIGGPAPAAHAFRAGLVDEVPPVRVPAHRRRRHSISPRPAPSEPSPARRAQVRQLSRVPAVPSLDLT